MNINPEVKEKINMFAKRLNEALDLRLYPAIGHGRTSYIQEIFAVSRVGAHNWLHGKALPHKKKRVEIANKLGISLLWLETGIGDKLETNTCIYEAKNHAIEIPLISLVDACHIENLSRDELYKKTIIASEHSENDTLFSVKYAGNSMSPKFINGSTLIIKSNFDLIDGDYVLTKVNNIPEAICRQYIVGAENNYLVAINPKFEAIVVNLDINIIGKIIEVRN